MFKCINHYVLRPGDWRKAIQTAVRQPPSIMFCVLYKRLLQTHGPYYNTV